MRAPRWVRKWSRDVETDAFSPLPMQVISNEEYVPLPQTREQQRVAALIEETARTQARRLAVSRRDFLASSAGMASAFLALDAIVGRFFEIGPVEGLESAAADERKPPDQFIFDIQTHHVAAPRQFPSLLGLRRLGRPWNRELEKDRGTMEDLYLDNYIKEIFLDSDTTVAVISGIPSATDANNILPPNKMAETRDVINRLAASQRLVAHGLFAPNKGPTDLDEMRRQRPSSTSARGNVTRASRSAIRRNRGVSTTRRSRIRYSRSRAASASGTSACIRGCRCRTASRSTGIRGISSAPQETSLT